MDSEWAGLTAAGARGLRWKAPFSGPVKIVIQLRVEERGRFVDFLRLA